jgi:5'-methylthioinosine phosphorylase
MKRLGLIGGTGLDHWGDALKTHKLDAAYGEPSAEFAEYQIGLPQVFFLPRHGPEHTIPPHAVNYQANIDGFRQLEVEGILAVNAVGGISGRNAPGTLSVPDQLIDYTWGRAASFSMSADDHLQHIEFAWPFEGSLRLALIRAANDAGIDVNMDGCIGITQGPRLETAAEIQRHKDDGCDMIGMTTMPEAALAREVGIQYTSLCVNANWAAGLDNEPVTMEAIALTLETAMVDVRKVLAGLFDEFSDVG